MSLEELLKTADIISLNASVTSESYHLLSDKESSLMKKGVIIAKTARGEVMDEKALIKALDEEILGESGTDVVEGEPIDEHYPLLAYDNVVITPHTSAYTHECLNGMGDKVATDVEKTLKGEAPDAVINTEVLKVRQCEKI